MSQALKSLLARGERISNPKNQLKHIFHAAPVHFEEKLKSSGKYPLRSQ
jgi:hypothetical protein